MMGVLEVVLWVLAVLVLVPMAVVVAECLTALLPRRRQARRPVGLRPRCAVLIPAHDEEAGIGGTIRALLPQLQPGDRVVVVADNCTDRTAEAARALGAVAVERTDPERRGKGYALDFGVRFLEQDPPAVVAIVDADCVVHDGALDLLVREAARGQAVQASYVLDEPPQARYVQQLSAFAFRFKNVVRPLGLSRLGAPCLLTGSGMAFPWQILRDASLASGNIVEDMRLGVDLAVAGHPPRLCPQAWVSSELPTGGAAAVAQRKRWEHGHVQTLLTQVPRLVAAAVRRGRPGLLGLALELSVPPLSLLFLLWAAVLAGAVGLWLAEGSPLPAAVLAGGGLAVLLAIFAAWVKFGRDRLPLTSLLAAPFYVLWKVPIYLTFFFRRQGTWNRTERAAPPAAAVGSGREQDRSQAEQFWRQALKGFRAPTSLLTVSPPLGTALPAGPPHAARTFRMSAELTAALQAFIGRHELTLEALIQGAFAALLSRYSGEEDVVFGVARARRAGAGGAESLTGLFGDPLPCRARVSPEITVLPFLKDLSAQSLAVRQHEYTPLLEVRGWSEIPHGMPLFESVLVFEKAEGGRLKAESESLSDSAFSLPPSAFPMTYPLVVCTRAGERLLLDAFYQRPRFEEAAIDRMFGHLQTLLEGFLADPQRHVAALPVLAEAEYRQVVRAWNDTRADYPRDRCVHSLFEDQAARTPDRPAVVFEGQQLTYRELNARANQVAHYLKTLGVGPETLVGLCVERSAEMVVGLLGILKAGGAYVPLDPEFPRDRLAHYVEDSAMPVLLMQQRMQARLPEHNARAVCLDTDWGAIAQHGTDNPPPGATAANLVYVIYTSGSTGKPKGVQVLHGPLTNFLNSMRRQPGLTEQDILVGVTTLSFDIHTLELWLPLTVGARVVVVSRDVARDGLELARVLHESGATVLQATPATWRLLLETGWEGGARLKALCGGEPLTVELAAKLLPRVGSLWNLYGPTETTVWSTLYRVRSPGGPILIGRPIDNTQVYVVDRHFNPVPVGAVGELLIGGDGVARGYLNRPELTAEKFIPDPFAPPSTPTSPGGSVGGERGARVYRTGDLARYLPDGNLECLGRIDHQVKVRGFRIELGEIETALGRHPGVKTNVVVARKEAGADTLAAYLIPHAGQDCGAEVLRRFLGKTLPDYMVPSHFVLLESFPLTPNGKIDRKALPDPQQGTDGQARPVVAPRSNAEQDLAPVWEEVLKVKPIGVTDNFFQLGGNSLLAAVLVARIKQQLGHTLPLGALLAAPTIEKLASVLEHQMEASTDSSLVPLHEEGSNPPLFMVAGVGGHVFTFHKFARLLGPEQPVYGVKAIGVDGTALPPSTVEDMAAHYVKEIMAIRPQGPYLLSGYSIGAIIAYELALQLRSLGHRVDALFVFDMLAPGYPRKLPLPRRLWMHLLTFFRLPLREKNVYLKERLGKIRIRLLHWLGLGIRLAPDVAVEGLSQDALKRVWLALVTAASHYRPKSAFDGKVVLFKAGEGFQWAATILDDPLYGWGPWASGGVDTHTVPGNHMEIFHDKNINLVARKVIESIRQATTGS